MKVTTTIVDGKTTAVVIEADNGVFGRGVVKSVLITLAGKLLSRSEFVGLTMDQIREGFYLEYEGSNLLSLSQVTLDSDGVIDLGYAYNGSATLTQLKSF